jgi:hypothetical protein
MKQNVLFLLKIAVGIAAFAFLFRKIDPVDAARLISQIRLPLLLCAFMCLLAGQFLQAIRWGAILAVAGLRTPLLRIVAINYVGVFFSSFLPSSIGGDVPKSLYVGAIAQYGSVLTTSVLSRVAGMLATFLLGVAAMGFAPDAFRHQPWWSPCQVALCCATAMSGLVLFVDLDGWVFGALRRLHMPSRVVGVFTGLLVPLRRWRQDTSTILRTLLLAFLFLFVGYIGVIEFCAWSLDISLPLSTAAMISAIVGIAFALPISVNGVGVAEGVYAYLFVLVGVAPEKALLLALLFRFLLLTQAAIGGVIYFFLKRTAPDHDKAVSSQC